MIHGANSEQSFMKLEGVLELTRILCVISSAVSSAHPQLKTEIG